MDLIGIENEGEFFPAGALSEGLQDELREVSGRWTADLGSENPLERLKRSARNYLGSLRQIENTSDADRRQSLRSDALCMLVVALGYEWRRDAIPTALEGDKLVPLVGRAVGLDGRDIAWLLEAPLSSVGDEAIDPLSKHFESGQFAVEDQAIAECDKPIAEILAKGIFGLKNGPRFVLVVDLGQIVLVDRNRWASRAVLRFDLREIFDRVDHDTLLTTACLISREARAPFTGVPIADRLEEEAQRNANTVTSSLKATVRDAIELLGQEVLNVTGGKYPTGPNRGKWVDGPELSIECLRYMYRLLFLFYAEANPRLGILDLRDPVYGSGYSLEALRELESRRLRSPQEKEGTFLWESLQLTLSMIYDGRGGALKLPAVKVSLLDPESTPILNSVRLRNVAIQQILRLLSLKRTRSGTSRISYAKLGIGQLGAVYETLISFTGVVAKEDLIELKIKAKRTGDDDETSSEVVEDDDDRDEEEDAVEEPRTDKIDLLAPSYFVPKHRAAEFRPEQIVFDGPTARVYPKGSFIYRLAGRDREKSASYYTPEPLARLLVSHALLERCKEMPADEILNLKILEPAMGSAAFLVETTNQLADLYLDRKQQEVGRIIPQDEILLERQKVRSFISDRNCFGVDLNPIAVELGAISLWLNSLHRGDFSPWFGDQLHAGNSLLGARRAAYNPQLLTSKKKNELWYNESPTEIGWKGARPKGFVWQFLLPADGMASFETERTIADFAGAYQDYIKAWKRGGFFEKFEPHEVQHLHRLSIIVDQLFDEVADSLEKSRASTNDAITLWPDVKMSGTSAETFREKQRRIEKLTGVDHAANTLPYKRLKTAMDAWCALWLWPLDKSHLLPSRPEFLSGMAMILEGGFSADGSLAASSASEFAAPQFEMFNTSSADKEALNSGVNSSQQATLFRETNVEALIETSDWLRIAANVAEKERFAHFDLIFADVMRLRSGFDIIVGNPPWAKPSWNEGLILSDIDPLYAGLSASESKKILAEALHKTKGEARFLSEFVSTRGAMAMTSSNVMNPFVGGGQNNLYRCFVDLSFRLVAPAGFAALIHQDGHLGDPKSGKFRANWYARIVKHFGYINTIKTKNFADAAHYMRFSQNIYRGYNAEPEFAQFTTAFLAKQVDESFTHDGSGEIPKLKGADGNWDTRGHRDRIVLIKQNDLAVIHSIAEESSVPITETRLIQPYSRRTLEVFRSMALSPKFDAVVSRIPIRTKGADVTAAEEFGSWHMDRLWDETNAQKEGITLRATEFRKASEMVLQGPHIHVGNPLYKTPRSISRNKGDYDVVDLPTLPNEYVPRTNYGPGTDAATYQSRLARCRWSPTKYHTDFFRVAFRRMVNLNSERSLIAALIPPKIAHVNVIESLALKDERQMQVIYPVVISLVGDFLVKASGIADFRASTLARFPCPSIPRTAWHRSLRLAALTSSYAEIWNREREDAKNPYPWSSVDHRLEIEGPVEGPVKWDRTAGLRTEFARRLALVEIDVLVAQALSLSLDQLIEIYGIYFSVLQEYEAGTWFDQRGRIVWTCSKGLPGVGWLDDRGKSPGRAAWERLLADAPQELTCTAIDDTMPGGPRTVTRHFVGPFTQCDRVEDYKRAWIHFEKHKEDVSA